MSVITLTLLHLGSSVPVQSWTFENEPTIKVGRSVNNDVVLYSAVVSRHHIEIRRNDKDWEVVNLGANGTYLNGKLITRVKVVDGMIIRLASSGPTIQIHLEIEESPVKGKLSKFAQSLDTPSSETAESSFKETISSS